MKNFTLKNMIEFNGTTVYACDCGEENILFSVRRVSNDLYGNPIYKLTLTKGELRHVSEAHRNYLKKGYYLIQSYDIEEDLSKFLTEYFNI